ncbi:MAG: tRNA pseudouridine(13) synthase TruD, partial [Candidatus Methanomethyliaceae archaeon]
QELDWFRYPWGTVAIPRYPLDPGLRGELLALEIPLPTNKTLAGLERETLAGRILAVLLAEEGLQPQDLKARGLERAYLGGGKRALWVLPAEPKLEEPEPDELFPGQKKLSLGFVLPPGSYATLLLRLLHVAPLKNTV